MLDVYLRHSVFRKPRGSNRVYCEKDRLSLVFCLTKCQCFTYALTHAWAQRLVHVFTILRKQCAARTEDMGNSMGLQEMAPRHARDVNTRERDRTRKKERERASMADGQWHSPPRHWSLFTTKNFAREIPFCFERDSPFRIHCLCELSVARKWPRNWIRNTTFSTNQRRWMFHWRPDTKGTQFSIGISSNFYIRRPLLINSGNFLIYSDWIAMRQQELCILHNSRATANHSDENHWSNIAW